MGDPASLPGAPPRWAVPPTGQIVPPTGQIVSPTGHPSHPRDGPVSRPRDAPCPAHGTDIYVCDSKSR